MRALPLFRRPAAVRLFLSLCATLCVLSAAAQNTTISGTVYAPKSTFNANPDVLPNILVYLAPPGVTPPDINHDGAGVTGGCNAQTDLVGLTPLVYTTTDYKGNFTLVSPVINKLPAGTYDLVIQAGKWRRQFNISLTPGQDNPQGPMYMPGSGAEGDLPKIAVVTGGADGIECILKQMGIADSEVTAPSGTGHINIYQGTEAPGVKGYAGSTDTEAGLMDNASVLNGYDLLLLGCQGTSFDPTVTNNTTGLTNLANYTNAGGRVFGTHFEYVWLNKPQTFISAAKWSADTTPNGGLGTIDINTSFPEGVTLAQWMQYIGSSGTAGYGKIPNVGNLRQDQTGVNTPPSLVWGTLEGSGNPVMQFSFDTPISTASSNNGATVSLAFTNTPTTFQLGDTGDQINLNITNTSTVVGNNLVVTLAVPAILTPTALAGANANTNWSCSLSTLTCTNTALNAGASDPILLTVDVGKTNNPGQTSVSATVSGTSLTSGNSSCGRVMYNEYHVESGSNSAGVYPAGCSATFTPAEKFLEFSLYNLSNFISPSNTDQITIQATPTITWNPVTPDDYGSPLTDIENATADTQGTFAYTFTPAFTGSVPDVGTYTVKAAFTPTDTADYLSNSATRQVTIVADATSSTVTQLDTDIHYGEEIGYNNGVDAALTITTAPGFPNVPVIDGAFAATIDGTTVCSGSQGIPITGGSRPGTCPDANFLGWDVGVHNVQLTYAGTLDFLPSRSPIYPVTIEPDPTATTLAASTATTQVSTGVTFTASVADIYTSAVGPVVFYDSITPNAAINETAQNINPVLAGMTPIGTGTVNASTQSVTLNLPNMIAGKHNISACFVSPVDKIGTYDFLNSCSASTQVLVTLPVGALPATATTLTSSDNPSLVNENVTFTATVGTTGAFPQTPSGAVTFLDGATTLGTGQISANGIATFSTTGLSAGTHNITASYAGSATLAASVSAVFTQTVISPMTLAGPGFLLIVNPTTVPVYVGSTAIVSVKIVPLTNFQQPVALACTGLPAEASCTFAQSTIPVGGGTTQLIVSSGGPHDCNNSTPYASNSKGGALPLLAFSTLTLCLARRRRKLQGLALAVMLCVLPGVLSGCGSGNCTDFSVKPGDYSFTVTATPGSLAVTAGPASAYTTAQTANMTMHVHL